MTAIAPIATGMPRINLMPKSEIARRERDKLVRGWTWGVLAAIVVAALVILGAVGYKIFADTRLASEQVRSNQLLLEIASLEEVSTAVRTEQELTDFRTEAMATDLEWTPLVSKVTSVLPGDTVLTSFDFAVGAAPATDDPTSEVGVSGTFSVESPTALDIVPLIRALRGVEGVFFADGQSVTSSQAEQGRFSYLLTVDFDQTAYSGEFAAAEEEAE